MKYQVLQGFLSKGWWWYLTHMEEGQGRERKGEGLTVRLFQMGCSLCKESRAHSILITHDC